MKWVVIKEHTKTITLEAEYFQVHESGVLVLYNKTKKSVSAPTGQVLVSAFRDWRAIVKLADEKAWK